MLSQSHSWVNNTQRAQKAKWFQCNRVWKVSGDGFRFGILIKLKLINILFKFQIASKENSKTVIKNIPLFQAHTCMVPDSQHGLQPKQHIAADGMHAAEVRLAVFYWDRPWKDLQKCKTMSHLLLMSVCLENYGNSHKKYVLCINV